MQETTRQSGGRQDVMTTTAPRKIRALIVDDEPLARERMRSLLGSEQTSRSSARPPTALEAVDAILDRIARTSCFSTSRCRLRRLRRHPDRRRRADAGRRLRDGLRPVRAARVRGPRARLPAQAVRPRPLPGRAQARAPRRSRTPTRGDLGKRLLALVQDLKTDAPTQADRLVVKSGGRVFFLRDGRDRLDRGGGQLRAPARRRRSAPAARDDERRSRRGSTPRRSSASTARTSSTSSGSRNCSRGSTASTS